MSLSSGGWHGNEMWPVAWRRNVPYQRFVGMTWGVDEINALPHSLQDATLKELQLDGVQGDVSAH